MLCVKNNISSFDCSPISIVETTKSKRFSININDIIDTVNYSNSIRALDIRYHQHLNDSSNTNNNNLREITEKLLKNIIQQRNGKQGYGGLDFLYITTEVDIDYLSLFISLNPPIKHLFLNFRFIPNQSFFNSLSNNQSLKSIQINHRFISQDHDKQLLQSILQNTTLQYLLIPSIQDETCRNKVYEIYDIIDYDGNSTLLKRKLIFNQQQQLKQQDKEKEQLNNNNKEPNVHFITSNRQPIIIISSLLIVFVAFFFSMYYIK